MGNSDSSLAAIVLLYALSAIGGYSLYFLKHGVSIARFTCKGVLNRLEIPPLVDFT